MKTWDEALLGALSERRDPSGLPLRSILAEQEALLALGRAILEAAQLGQLTAALYSAARSNPAQGLRGSELTLRMSHASAAARARIHLSVLRRVTPALGRSLGIQSVEVKVARAHTEAPPAAAAQPRPQIPETARQRLLAALEAQDH